MAGLSIVSAFRSMTTWIQSNLSSVKLDLNVTLLQRTISVQTDDSIVIQNQNLTTFRINVNNSKFSFRYGDYSNLTLLPIIESVQNFLRTMINMLKIDITVQHWNCSKFYFWDGKYWNFTSFSITVMTNILLLYIYWNLKFIANKLVKI